MVGKSLSGKTTLSEVLKEKLNFKIIDMKKI
jgi:dephospho-CoA kinase